MRSLRNIGIDFLKILACFAVISLHFGSGGYGRRLAVPIFVFFSCYLCAYKGGKTFIFKRLYRLWFPFIIWGVIGIVIYSLASNSFTWNNIAWQLSFGYPYAQHLYYLMDLIFITCLIWGVRQLPNNTCKKMVLVGLAIGCVVLQYTGWNYRFCAGLPDNMRYTIGRLAELLPCAIVADIIGEYRLIDLKPRVSFVCSLIAFSIAACFFVVHKRLP
jgi:surface polysaccharide O-acyltransferase-like enzyme